MSEKTIKPIKKWDMVSSYALGIVAQLLTIVMWFLPSAKAVYSSNVSLFGEIQEFDIYLFSYKENLPVFTNYINLAFLIVSIISMIYMALPLIRNTVMKPHNMIFPAVFNLLYLALFAVRYFSSTNEFLLYDITGTAFLYIYVAGIIVSLSMSVAIIIETPKLKKQLDNDVEA